MREKLIVFFLKGKSFPPLLRDFGEDEGVGEDAGAGGERRTGIEKGTGLVATAVARAFVRSRRTNSVPSGRAPFRSDAGAGGG